MWSYYARTGLGIKLVLSVLLVSTFISLLATGVQLYRSYQSGKVEATRALNFKETSIIHPLQDALWHFNFTQVDLILDGLFADAGVSHLAVVTPTGHKFERGAQARSELVRVYKLAHPEADASLSDVGVLTVTQSLEPVRNRVWDQFWVLLISNVIKAYTVSLAMLVIFHRLVTRHLRAIAHHIDVTAPASTDTHFRLDRPENAQPDDLDKIVDAFQAYEARVSGHVQQLNSEIDERELAEQKTQTAIASQGMFFAKMSHEIRTPLNAILGLLHLIKTAEPVPEKYRVQAEVAHNAAEALQDQLVNSIDLARLESDAVIIRDQQVDVRKFATRWAESARGNVHRREKSVEVELKLDEGLAESYRLDGNRLTQVVTNLVDNAIKFTHEGRIVIAVYRADEGSKYALHITVSDTGIGIPADEQELIFDRFSQLDEGLERATGGSGLGLAICSELAELMGGELSVQSPSINCLSTTFTLNI